MPRVLNTGTCIHQGDLFHSAGQQEKNWERFWKNAGEWTGRVEISKEELPGSKRSMYGYILTYSRFEGDGEKWSRRNREGRHCKGNIPDNSRSKHCYTVCHDQGLKRENISYLQILRKRGLHFCVRCTTTRVLRRSTAKVISGQISKHPQIKVIICYSASVG